MRQDKIKAYYDYTRGAYRIFWHGDTHALHYGIWTKSTRTLREALLNTNKFLADYAEVKAGEKILDAGCGIGGSALWLAQNRGSNVTGITISERQLVKARELAELSGLTDKLEFYNDDYTATHFPDKSFDVVWAIESICHAPDKEAFLREAARLLKASGRLIVADGFLMRKPENKQEQRLLNNLLRGAISDNLARVDKFENWMVAAGFQTTRRDVTLGVMPSARIMARMCRWGYPLAKLTTWLGLTPALLVNNNRAGIDQWSLLKNGIVSYSVFLGQKSS